MDERLHDGLTGLQVSAPVRDRLNKADDTLKWVHGRIDGLRVPTLPTEKRTQLACACWHVAFEHHQAIVILTHEGLYGSARALIRPLFEAYVRGLWLKLAASDKQVDDAGRDQFPEFGLMIGGIEATGQVPQGGLSAIKAGSWKRLCSLTHTGYQQIRARLTPEGLGYAYTDGEIMEALIWADWIVLHAVVAFGNTAGDESVARAAAERILAAQQSDGVTGSRGTDHSDRR
jgi:hypothetical protein